MAAPVKHVNDHGVYVVPHYSEQLWFKYILSAAAATVAETATYPLDLTKTRLQIQGEIAHHHHHGVATDTVPHKGMVRTALGIVKEEGLHKLWQGVTPAIYRHLVYTGCRMTFYEKIREVLGKNDDGTFSFWKAVTGGVVAGGAAQFIASPTDLVKVQMQMEGRRRLEGKPLRVKGVADALKNIVRESGVRGLWKGWAPNVQRAALVNLGGKRDMYKIDFHHTPL
ncbi:PREDICTED: mitochondrial uncoupling protein 4-like [Priapulus caudatus]|uniref:Mitochondrial uncoupling protein 4-like n=1 Tax=Priapulus caudatus TaxID=37621 RepID=A0ABM1EP86_PRICU|nr:PREDICTED: mitochondrial uncoupling protein 4-like [Priapulus caudatus]